MWRLLVVVLGVAWAVPARTAVLPPHGPLEFLVIGDEVNPHGLTDAQLTQPADIQAALRAPDSGLRVFDRGVSPVDSQCIDDALTELGGVPPSVVIYFAHQAAKSCAGEDRQPQLTAALERFLQQGGGIVVFHHGLYTAAGKDPILQLLGGRASSIAWDTTTGQRVFNVAPGHFVTTNGISYAASAQLTGGAGAPSGMFPYFDNIPDERYPATELIVVGVEQRQILFASDSGGSRVLGYALERPGWSGRVVWYQPAEYQPHALDDRAGPNFQILANAILYSVRQENNVPLSDDYFPDAGTGGGGGGGLGGCCDAAPGGPPWLAVGLVALGLARRGRRRTRDGVRRAVV